VRLALAVGRRCASSRHLDRQYVGAGSWPPRWHTERGQTGRQCPKLIRSVEPGLLESCLIGYRPTDAASAPDTERGSGLSCTSRWSVCSDWSSCYVAPRPSRDTKDVRAFDEEFTGERARDLHDALSDTQYQRPRRAVREDGPLRAPRPPLDRERTTPGACPPKLRPPLRRSPSPSGDRATNSRSKARPAPSLGAEEVRSNWRPPQRARAATRSAAWPDPRVRAGVLKGCPPSVTLANRDFGHQDLASQRWRR
jgi:hypothetical protein